MGASKSGLSNSMSSPQQPAGQQTTNPYQGRIQSIGPAKSGMSNAYLNYPARQQIQGPTGIPPTDSPDKFYSWLVEQAKRNPRGTKNG